MLLWLRLLALFKVSWEEMPMRTYLLPIGILVVLILIPGTLLRAQFSLTPDKIYQLEALLNADNRPDRPGLAVGIAVDGKPVYLKGVGMANLETGAVFTPESVSDIGSVAKQMTCLAIVLLAQEGKLHISDDIRTYIPEFKNLDTVIQIQHLIHHLSGIREIYAMLALSGWRNGDGIRQEHAIDLISHATSLNYAPGTQYMYCNTAYMLLGEIVARVSGMRFEQFMRQRIFEPLGMEHTYLMDVQGEVFPNCAESYTPVLPKGWVKIYDNSTAYGQGGVYSTVPDMLRWADNFRTGKVGGKKAIDLMMLNGKFNNGEEVPYAFGLEHLSYRGIPIIQHTGSSAGYRAALTLIPSKGVTLFLKGNYASIQSIKLTNAVLDILFGDSMESAMVPEAPESKSIALEPFAGAPLTNAVGSYYCPELDGLFYLEDNRGNYRFGNRRLDMYPLTRVSETSFVGEGGIQIECLKDKKGAIVGLSFSNGELLNLKMVPVALTQQRSKVK